MKKSNVNLEITPKSLKLNFLKKKKTLKVPLKNVSFRMLNVFEKDVLSKINNQYQDLYQLMKKI